MLVFPILPAPAARSGRRWCQGCGRMGLESIFSPHLQHRAVDGGARDAAELGGVGAGGLVDDERERDAHRDGDAQLDAEEHRAQAGNRPQQAVLRGTVRQADSQRAVTRMLRAVTWMLRAIVGCVRTVCELLRVFKDETAR
eukprot:1194845-Prorocentrum_minimum.AAC.2